MSIKKTIVFLAAGLGSRYNGLKQVEGILPNNSPILEYSLFDAIWAGFDKFVFIINASVPESFIHEISEILQKRNLEFHWIIQKTTDFVPEKFSPQNRAKPFGTGHAVLCAKNVVDENFLVINADDFYGRYSFETAFKLMENQIITSKNYAMIAYPLENTLSKNGSVSRGICTLNESENLKSIEELTKIQSENSDIFAETETGKRILNPNDLVSMNFWIFHPSFFGFLENGFNDFIERNPKEKEEFFLPSVVGKCIEKNGISVAVKVSNEIWKGVTYPEDKTEVREFLMEKTEKGIYPENLWN